ncbi:MAG: beta-phosphoglucomutase, partial [Spirochaetales bacterium]
GAHEPLLLRCHPLTIYRHKVLKQPDLVLASFLLHDWFSAADRLRAFDFYDPLTTGDSSLSAPVQCITSAAAGYPETAYGYFRLTCLSDTADVHGNTKDGLHLAAAAGTWLSVVYGFLGLHDRGAVPRFFPRYPKTSGWTSLTAKLLLRGNLVELTLKPDEMIYVLKEGKDAALTHEYTPVTLKKPGDISSHSLVPKLEAVIFDLDGVITDTAEFHYLAWKKIADELGLPFDRELNHRLRGIGRMESLAVIIENARADISGERRAELAARKNGYYREYLETLTPEDLLAGIEDLLEDLKKDGVKTALASASKNAQLVLSKLKAGGLFDTVIDAGRITVGKPDPEIFLKAAELLETPCRNCAGIEDAQAGIDAIRAAGMVSVGIGSRLRDADLVLGGTEELTLPALRKLFS